ERHVEDMVRVLVLAHGPRRHGAIDSARDDHRDLALEGDEFFQHRGLSLEWLPSLREIVAGPQLALAFSVVAKCRGLQHAGQSDFRSSGRKLRSARDFPEWCDGDFCTGEKFLLAQPVLA